jgi:4-amino-4-deoxy-L-arabinose transferase-like glycosyltransferase
LFAVVVIVYLVCTAWNLNLQTVAWPDEPRYAAPARAMLRDGNWIVPVFNAQPRIAKPILFYWIIAGTGAAGQAAGLSLVTAMRLGPLLVGLLAVVATFVLGRRIAGAWCGFLAAMILTTTRFFHECSRQLVTDLTLAACVVWAWLFAHIALDALRHGTSSRGTRLPLLGYYLAVGLASMAKGPVLAALFCVLPLLVYLVWARRLGALKRAGLWWGVPLALAVGCWWFVALSCTGFEKELKELLMQGSAGRMTGHSGHERPIPFLFYILDLGQNFLPWVVLLPCAIWWTVKKWRAGTAVSDHARFLACMLGVPFVLLGLVIGKRDFYILPLYPLLALWIAWMWHEVWGLPRRRAALAVLAVAALLTIGYEAAWRPRYERQANRAAFYAALKEKLDGKPVVLLGLSSNEAVWYLDRPTDPIDDVRRPDLKARFFDAPGTRLLLPMKLLDAETGAALKAALTFEVLPEERDGERYALALPDPAHPPDPSVFVPLKGRAAQPQGDE